MAKSDEVWMLECHSNSCNILQRAGKSGGAECQEVLRQSIWTNFRLTSSKRTRNATGWSSGGENPTEKGSLHLAGTAASTVIWIGFFHCYLIAATIANLLQVLQQSFLIEILLRSRPITT